MLSGKAKIVGVMGWPVSHSLSPRLHNYWINHYNLDAAYIPLAVKPEDLAEVVRSLPKQGFRGFNITIPHKEAIIPFLDYMDDDAKAIGAVNTVLIASDGTLQGMNTDAYGFMRNIRPHIAKNKNKAVLLGAGGAAKAICHGLIKEGFASIVVVNRSVEKALALAEQFPGKITVKEWDERHDALELCDLLVNSTSLGMENGEPLDISIEKLPTSAVVSDIVYTPLQTKLLRAAKDHGCLVVDGLGMLIHQAIPGFKSWFGVNPEITLELRPHLLKATP